MEIPPHTSIVENPIFTMWLEDSGLLCYISKKHPSQTLEETKILFAEIRRISSGQKRCMLMDLTYFQMPSRESRELGAIELPKMVNAIAFLSGSVLGTVVANFFFKIKKQPYPTRMFTDEKEARKWLQQFCN